MDASTAQTTAAPCPRLPQRVQKSKPALHRSRRVVRNPFGASSLPKSPYGDKRENKRFHRGEKVPGTDGIGSWHEWHFHEWCGPTKNKDLRRFRDREIRTYVNMEVPFTPDPFFFLFLPRWTGRNWAGIPGTAPRGF